VTQPKRGDFVYELDKELNISRGLIKSAKLYRQSSSYGHFEAFARDAERYFGESANECPQQNYFSYMPQYSQLNDDQLAWYLYWRGEVRKGNYLKTKLPYILLLVFETINVKLLKPSDALTILTSIWKAYRADYKELDTKMAEYVTDFCLLKELAPPVAEISEFLPEVITNARLREFYLCGDSVSPEFAKSLILSVSSYNYVNGKFISDELTELNEKLIPGAISHLFAKTKADFGSIFADSQASAVIKREAFAGGVSAGDMRRLLEVEYYSFSRSFSFRYSLGDAVKFCENKIRYSLGIKSRLSIANLPEQAKNILLEYLLLYIESPKKKANVSEELSPEYAELYSEPVEKPTMAAASAIEQNSWKTTELLLSSLNDEEEIQKIREEETPKPEELNGSFTDLLSPEGHAFLRGAAGLSPMPDVMLPDALAEYVNELAADFFGDIIIEKTNGAYTLMDEYKDEVLGLL
jgi:hypothetical protein